MLRYDVVDHIAQITLDRPPANALSLALVEDVIGHIDRAGADPEVKALILASALPTRFSGGLDLDLLSEANAGDLKRLLDLLYVEMIAAQQRLGKPSIAAIDGAARAGGMTMALACDIVVAGKTATFGYPEIAVGLIPAIHFRHLPRTAGRHRAFDLLFSGAPFGAEAAYELGLVSRLAEPGTALFVAREIAADLAAKPADALAMGRAAFRQANDQSPAELAAAVDAFCKVAATPSARAAVKAFGAKR